MQIFVMTAAISASQDTPVVATHADGIIIPEDGYPDATRFWFADGRHTSFVDLGLVLKPTWRDDLPGVINAEANYRITEAFPPYRQQNAAVITQKYMMQYGNVTTSWPIDAQDQQKEIDRGWTYVNNVRIAAEGLGATGPLNPCDNNLWPTKITPIQLTVL